MKNIKKILMKFSIFATKNALYIAWACFRNELTPLSTAFSIQRNDSISETVYLTHLSMASPLWGIGKQHSPRCDAAERGVPSGAILFARRNFIEK